LENIHNRSLSFYTPLLEIPQITLPLPLLSLTSNDFYLYRRSVFSSDRYEYQKLNWPTQFLRTPSTSTNISHAEILQELIFNQSYHDSRLHIFTGASKSDRQCSIAFHSPAPTNCQKTIEYTSSVFGLHGRANCHLSRSKIPDNT